jgi:hypothetical protein
MLLRRFWWELNVVEILKPYWLKAHLVQFFIYLCADSRAQWPIAESEWIRKQQQINHTQCRFYAFQIETHFSNNVYKFNNNNNNRQFSSSSHTTDSVSFDSCWQLSPSRCINQIIDLLELSNSDNFIPANPLVSPNHIKSECYFLLRYADWVISSILFILLRIDPLPGNARNIHAANNRGTVFSVVRVRTVAMQRGLGTLTRKRWHHTTIEEGRQADLFCRSAPRPLIGSSQRANRLVG